MSKYSQGNEQEIILNYFKEFKGTFMDCGSNDGITLSNTHALALSGWSGICVEASPKAFESLQNNYLTNDKVYCINVALADYNGKAILHDSGTHLNKNDVSLLSSLNKKETEKWRKTTEFTEVYVDVVDFKTLLNLSPYKTFDFLSIDIEGFDLIALRQMNLTGLGCKLICIEHNSHPEILSEIKSICAGFGLVNELLINAENVILSVQ